MATITNNQFLDDVARTAGEAMTINGGALTIRTDTRWHKNSPANMTGTLGSVTISPTLGGQYNIDATKVRWLPITGGSGSVAIGTIITQGGVSGYFLGAYATLTSAPSITIPATGFIKLREVDGGSFIAGALSGISASASGPDVTGWIEVVQDQATAITVPRLGRFQTRGDWFYLDKTNGSANQKIQIPTNGSATAYTAGVWIQDGTGGDATYEWNNDVVTVTFPSHQFVVGNEVDINFITGGAIDIAYHTYRVRSVTKDTFTVNLVGSGLGGDCVLESYDFYSAIYATGMSTTNFGTDIRSKVVLMGTDGSITIGHNGTTAVGYVPLANRKIRIPNIILRQCVTTTRAVNAIPHATVATRPDFTTTSAGYIDIEFVLGDWYFLFAQPYYVKLRHIATHDVVNISECATALELSDGGTGTSGGLAVANLTLTSCFAGGEIFSWIGAGYSAAVTGGQVGISYCIGQRFSACRFGTWTYARSATKSYSIYINQSSDIVVSDSCSINAINNINTSTNISFINYDYTDRYVGETNATTGLYSFTITNACNGVLIEGTSFGFKGLIPNVHPYNGLVSCTASSNIKIRNLGARDNILNGGTVNNPAYIFYDGGNNINVQVQRCYLQPTRTGAHYLQNSTKGVLLEDVYGDYTDLMNIAALNCIVRGGGGRNGVTGQLSVYGTHFGGAFDSDTTGRMWLALNEPTAETLQYTESNFTTGSGFTSAGGLSLATAGDYFICEMQESRLQTTGFANIAPTITGTNPANHTFEYQIDTGNGWNGEWKTLNGANLSSETILPNVGYKLKFKITCIVTNNANLISYVRCDTTSTLEAQVNNLYPLDVVYKDVSITDLIPGTEIHIYRASDLSELAQTESSGTTFTWNYLADNTEIFITMIKPGYKWVRYNNLLLDDSGVAIIATQQIDLGYSNPS